MSNGMAKVVARYNSIPAVDATGRPKTLGHGQFGWMPEDEARAAQERGEVQLLAGITTAHIEPTYDEEVPSSESKAPSKRKRQYERRDMTARDS